MANIKISELNELYGHQKAYEDVIPIVDTSANETKKISVKGLIPSNVKLIAITDTAPVEYETGDKYYNTTTDKIYTGTSYDWESPEDPVPDIFYVILEDQKTYTYDHINHEMISVGGGGGGGIAVYPDEPEEDTKIYIEEEDLDFQGLEISNTYTTGDNVAYSADYVNNLIKYEEVEASRSLTSGQHGYIGVTAPITPTGYSLIGGFISHMKGSQDTSQILVGGGGTGVHAINYASVTQTVTVKVCFVYIKTGGNS